MASSDFHISTKLEVKKKGEAQTLAAVVSESAHRMGETVQ